MMEEKQVGQFPKSKGPKKLQERDHFAKVWAAALHCLGTHFTKTLSETDKNNLSSEHKDQNLQGGEGLGQVIENVHTVLAIRFHNNAVITHGRN